MGAQIRRFGMDRPWWLALLLALGVVVLLDVGTYLIAEGFWFEEVGYLQIFSKRLLFQVGLGLLVFVASLGVMWGNLRYAYQQLRQTQRFTARELGFMAMPLRLVLPLSLLLAGLMGFLLVYHGQIAISHWQPNVTIYGTSEHIPANFSPDALWRVTQQMAQQPWVVLLLLGIVAAVMLVPQVALGAIALLMSLGFALVLSENWIRILPAFNPVPFEQADPVFGRDLRFYIFQLPVLELLVFWLLGLFALALTTVLLVYLLGDRNLSNGQFPGVYAPQLRHLWRLSGWFMLAIAFNFWVDRYQLLYSQDGVVYGASFTDLIVRLPVFTLLSLAAIGLALWLLGQWLWHRRSTLPTPRPIEQPNPRSSNGNGFSRRQRERLAGSKSNGKNNGKNNGNGRRQRSVLIERRPLQPIQSAESAIASPGRTAAVRRTQPPRRSEPRYTAATNHTDHAAHNDILGQSPAADAIVELPWAKATTFSLIGYWAVALLLLYPLPWLVQGAVVQPNELELELPYLERAIALTREGFDLSNIQSDVFNPQGNLTQEDIERNSPTTDNIRLWDTRPLLETNRQLQRIRSYYEFPDADIDRYLLPTDDADEPLGLRQVLIAARELDYDSVPAEAQTWINKHLIYTHGYGFTLSPVNTVAEGGLPQYFIDGIEQDVSDPRIRTTIPLESPRIYYGEMSNTHVMTQTRVLELDYPSGSENVYNSYDGDGGIGIGAYWRRLLFAKHLRDWRMLFSADLTSDSRLLFRRVITQRVRAIAPFLRFDSNPYIVSARVDWSELEGDRPRPSRGNTSNLYWILDAYTTSDRYPYSDPAENDFNYIRNSVKVVIDAYNGAVWFFNANPNDPVIKTWSRTFPGVFFPLQAMPEALLQHIRYPTDFYNTQSQHLMVYHMTDPRVFYNREDLWRSPNEIYGDEQLPVEPYYLIMSLPTNSAGEEFILLRPFAPAQRTNLIGWLAARSDGENYGRMLLYRFPKQELVFGPEQIEARINQDPVISQQISLWNRRGSQAVQGNLLVIPIENSLLYVEPIYLQAEQNRLPTLVRVIVAYGNQIVMAETLQQALDAIFQNGDATGAVVRPLTDFELPDNDTSLEPQPLLLESGAAP